MWCCWKYTKHIQFGSENWETKRTERPSLMGNLGPTFKDRPSWWLVNWATFINQSLGYVTSWLFITNVTIFKIPVYPSYLITTLIYVAFYNWDSPPRIQSETHIQLQLRPTGLKNKGALGGVLCAAIILSKLQAYGRSFPHSHVKEEENMNSLFSNPLKRWVVDFVHNIGNLLWANFHDKPLNFMINRPFETVCS